MPTETATTDQRGPSITAESTSRSGRSGRTMNVFSQAFLILWALMVAVPLLWAVMSSLKSSKSILTDPWGLPTAIEWKNFVDAWNVAQIGQYFLNSVVVVFFSLLGTMLLGAMAAYVLARFEFRFNRLIYYLFIAGMAFPIFLVLVPLYFVLKGMPVGFGIGTIPGLVFVYIAYSLPFTVFFLTSFFRTLPTSVAEAALIDGAGHTRTFFRIMLPMAKPGLISIGIFNLLGQWNQYLLPLVLNPPGTDAPVLGAGTLLTQGLAGLVVQQDYHSNTGLLFAGLVMAMAPVLVAYIIFQKQIQSGLTAGSIK